MSMEQSTEQSQARDYRYASNPLAEELRLGEYSASRYAEVAAVQAPPKMFTGGTSDLPAMTASGVDPQLLLRLPVGMRHAAADNPDREQVRLWLEDYSSMPDAVVESHGLREARERVKRWYEDTDTRTQAEIDAQAAEDEAFYQEFTRRLSPQGKTQAEWIEERREKWRREQELRAELGKLNGRR